MPEQLSVRAARRIALGAQGFRDPKPAGSPDRRHFRRVFRRLGLLQLDSVQAVCRSHYLPVLSRLGPYDRNRLDDWLWHSGEAFETWAHEASVVPVELEPLLRHRKRAAATGDTWTGLYRMARDHPEYVRQVEQQVRIEGPVRARELTDARTRPGTWWDGRSDGKRALDWLFRIGAVGSRRTPSFERVYDRFERIVPAEVLARPEPGEHEAMGALLVEAARCCGLGTADDLADYHRTHLPTARGVLADLVEDGRLHEVRVDGWPQPVYLYPDAERFRVIRARALLSPFDPVVWHRPRVERLFGFRYRIEIYVPEEKREFGYYVLPFLLDDELVGRVDVRADRKAGVLRVLGAWAEDRFLDDRGRLATDRPIVPELSAALRELAGFLGLEDLEVSDRGSAGERLVDELATG